jgi:uncharacterized protein (UPF0333 family)
MSFFKLKNKNSKKKGQAVVELALVFPFFLLIIVGGIVDFGFCMYNYLTLQQISSTAAAWGAENKKSDHQIQDYANQLKPKWWKENYSVNRVERTDLTQTQGRVIKLTLAYETPMLTPFYQILVEAAAKKRSINIAAMSASKEAEFLR